jgi:hypothetical protein
MSASRAQEDKPSWFQSVKGEQPANRKAKRMVKGHNRRAYGDMVKKEQRTVRKNRLKKARRALRKML